MFASPDVSFVLLRLFSLLACVFFFSVVGGVGGAFWVLPIFNDGFWNRLYGVWVTMAFCF
jgi:hypothetical protein